MDHPGIPGLHGTCRRGHLGPMHQPLQLRQHALPKLADLRIMMLRQASCPPDEMGQARLPAMDPVLVHAIAIADHNPGPAFDEGRKGGLTSAGLHGEQRHGSIDHHPQPRQHPMLIPGSLIYIVEGSRNFYRPKTACLIFHVERCSVRA